MHKVKPLLLPILVLVSIQFVQADDKLARLAASALNSVPNVALSHSGKYVATQDLAGDVWLLRATSADKQLLLHAKQEHVTLTWAANDQRIFVTMAGRISTYEVPSGRRSSIFVGSAALTFPQTSPDGRYTAMIRNHTLFLSHGSVLTPLLKYDSPNTFSGEPDPLFAHEFHPTAHYWWAPDSSSIVFLETVFATADHYPLPGAKLPIFRLKIVAIRSGGEHTVAESSEEWPYILRVAFHPDGHRLVFYRLNRLQNKCEFCLWDKGTLRTVLTEKDDYWVNAPATPVFLPDGNRLVVSSERSGHRRIYLYNLDGTLIRDLTPGDLDVAELFPNTSQTGEIFIQARMGDRQEQHLLRINTETAKATQLTSESGWHTVLLSTTGDIYLDTYSTSLKPPTVSWHVPNAIPRQISDPSPMETPVANDYLPIKTHDGVILPARLYKPDHFEPKKKYPIILYTFSGPADRVVADSWGGWQMAWNRYMVRKGYLVLTVDVRGSGGYSHLFEEYIHYRFGAQETVDLREVVSFLRAQSYVDPQRIGIWGTDYGGHTVVHAMFEFPHGFKAGFADSPITDWRGYDAYFTERYLGLPAQRIPEYNDSSALEHAKRLTGDLFVAAHPANPIILATHVDELQKAIVEAKKASQFRKITPQSVNYRCDPAQLAELFAAMTAFFDQSL
jgi:dipeptidyl-peptidase-4